jgi:hypothetical protein
MHNYFRKYHTPTCFDTIVLSSGSLQSVPCQVTQVFKMQLLVIQFIINMLVIVQIKKIVFFIKIIRGIIFHVITFNFLLHSTENQNICCGWFLNCIELGGVDGKITLRWIFRKWNVGVWTGSSCLREGTGAGSCECGNEPSGSVKCGEFLDREPVGSSRRNLLHRLSR